MIEYKITPKDEIPGLEKFLDFVESRDPLEEYSWTNITACPVAKYLGVTSFDEWSNVFSVPFPEPYLSRANTLALWACESEMPWRSTYAKLATTVKDFIEKNKGNL